MIGKIIGAVAGAQAARATSGLQGPVGAVFGVALVETVRRMGIPGLITVMVGGYILKRLIDADAAGTAPAVPVSPQVNRPVNRGAAPTG
jgi:hypothetical protein